jgi:hypothetical protein
MTYSIHIRTKFILTIWSILFISNVEVIAQDTISTNRIRNNTFFIEVLGNGGLYSLNYDRIFHIKKRIIASRAGFSYLPPWYANNHVFVFPVECTWLIPAKKDTRFFETGIGSTFITEVRNEDSGLKNFKVIPGIRLGYRLQKPEGGLFLKTGLLISFLDPERTAPLTIGFGIGYTLKSNSIK